MTLLADFPAIANPLPLAWDGATITWGDWSAAAFFICDRTARRASNTTCDTCDTAPRATLTIRGHVFRPEWALWVFRCSSCGADTVVDWNDDAWSLDESDYGPDGSWPEHDPTLFDHFPDDTCVICGRQGNHGFTRTSEGHTICLDDDLCARRADHQETVATRP